MHVDTTSFSVSGEYAQATAREEQTEAEPAIIAITYGYSRDHREDLKQWMLARASTHDGDIPLFLRPLDGNSSHKATLLMAITALQDQLRAADGEPSVYVADNGIYSEANMRQLNEAGVKWVSWVSETLTQAQTLLHDSPDEWQRSEDGSMQWFRRVLELPQGTERWVILRTTASLQRAQGSMQRQVSRTQTNWAQKCWHLSHRRFACEADARAALEREPT